MGIPVEFRASNSYGKSGYYLFNGDRLWFSSGAEEKWLALIEPLVICGAITDFQWQPGPYVLDYKYRKTDGKYSYTPDARIVWKDTGEEWWIEIKYGQIEQIAKTKIKRFCQQYPEKPLVVVWFGRLPSHGVRRRRFEAVQKCVHHFWHIK